MAISSCTSTLPATSAYPHKADQRQRESAFPPFPSALPQQADLIRTDPSGLQLTRTGLSRLRRRGLFQLLQQRLRVFQVGGVEALAEPVVDGGEWLVHFLLLANELPHMLQVAGAHIIECSFALKQVAYRTAPSIA